MSSSRQTATKGEQIASLLASQTQARDTDPENRGLGDSGARVSKVDYGDVSVSQQSGSKLRRAAQSAQDFGERYRGVKTSRKELGLEASSSSSDNSDDSDNTRTTASNLGGVEFASSGDEDEDMFSDKEASTFVDDHSQLSVQMAVLDDMQADEGFDDFQMFSAAAHVEVEEEGQDKATHVQRQAEIQDSLLRLRVALQPAMSLGNTLPRAPNLREFKRTNNKITKAAEKTTAELTGLLKDLQELQVNLVSNGIADGETALSIASKISVGQPPNLSDSDEDSDAEMTDAKTNTTTLSTDELWESVNSGFGCLGNPDSLDFMNQTLDQWHKKITVGAGRSVLEHNFQAINQGIVSQIDKIVQDEYALVRRTQLKRNKKLKVLGDKLEHSEAEAAALTKQREREAAAGIVGILAKDRQDVYDPELFDDTDFYQTMLQDMIAHTPKNLTDDRSDAQLKALLSKSRAKTKKKSVQKASKGRMIRYEVMPKIQNFMAPVDRYNDEFLADELFTNVFGGGN